MTRFHLYSLEPAGFDAGALATKAALEKVDCPNCHEDALILISAEFHPTSDAGRQKTTLVICENCRQVYYLGKNYEHLDDTTLESLKSQSRDIQDREREVAGITSWKQVAKDDIDFLEFLRRKDLDEEKDDFIARGWDAGKISFGEFMRQAYQAHADDLDKKAKEAGL